MDCMNCGHQIKRDTLGLGWQHINPGKIEGIHCYTKVESSKNVIGYCGCDSPKAPKQEKKEEPKDEKPKQPRRPSILDQSMNVRPSNIW